MRLKAYNFLLLFYLTLTTYAFQSNNVQVIDAGTSKPILGVEVYTKAGNFIGTTNDAGKVSLVSLKNNTKYRIVFFEYNYKTYETEITVGKTNSLVVKMEPLSNVLSEVVLGYKKRQAFGLTTLKPVEGTHIYAGKKSEVVLLDQEIANKSVNNARQIYAKVAGLNIYDSNDGGLQLSIGGRGLDPNRTANFNTRQNDYDISADVLGYPESYYTPPTEALEKIQVIRGAASLQYGTQFGGLINFVTKKPNPDKPFEIISRSSIGSFNLFTNFTSVSGTANKLSYYAYYNYKQGDSFRPNSGFDSKNAFAHVGYKFNDKTKIEAEVSHLNYLAQQAGGLSDVQFLEDPRQSYRTRNWFAVNWNLFNLKLEHKFSDKVSGTLSLFALDASRKAIGFRRIEVIRNGNNFVVNENPDIFGPDETDGFGNFDFERDLLVGNFKNYGAEARVITKYDIKNQPAVLLLGAKFYRANNTSQQGPGSKGSDANFTFKTDEFPFYPNQNKFEYPNLNASFFGENIFNITDELSVTPGFRFEYIKTESIGEYLERGSIQGSNPIVTFTPDNNVLDRNFLLLGVGVSYKPENYFETYFNFSQNYRSVTFSDIRNINPSFIVDPSIKDETGYSIDLGVRGKLQKIISYDVNIFSLLYDNRIGQVFSSEPPYRGQWVRGNIGKASIYGLESLVQWNLKETFFEENDNLKLDVFSNFAYTTSEYSSNTSESVDGNKVEFIPEVNFKTGVSFGYGNLLTSLQYSYLSEQFTDATNSEYNPLNNDRVDGAIPSYDILDFSASYSFTENIKLEAGVNNLLDNSYFTRRATGYPGPGIIPSAPRNWYTTLQFKF
ncbi:TonB-dependent receptor domain-containing protein [Tenacibaculum sp. M341]|uniref:TonB-dependent receptor domain-containing protein n=1 Tax=Tenacibaculum sp. M341 TaxID=2530339 RepID=UPI0010508446|nr:TonB-dependent receptor [Tenacibaculum sp. M341]TCI90726.1 TonB-dependent receptor [Tenacibaculum sp. M341]